MKYEAEACGESKKIVGSVSQQPIRLKIPGKKATKCSLRSS